MLRQNRQKLRKIDTDIEKVKRWKTKIVDRSDQYRSTWIANCVTQRFLIKVCREIAARRMIVWRFEKCVVFATVIMGLLWWLSDEIAERATWEIILIDVFFHLKQIGLHDTSSEKEENCEKMRVLTKAIIWKRQTLENRYNESVRWTKDRRVGWISRKSSEEDCDHHEKHFFSFRRWVHDKNSADEK